MNEATQPTGGAIRVGDFVVDPRSGELRGNGGRLILSAQPLHVLLALAERPGALVTRDELRGRLWPADTYVDFEHGLNAIVKRLRDALGDSADTPRYIETVPRRGYRLIAEVRLVDDAGVHAPVPAPLESAPLEPPPPAPDSASAVPAGTAVGSPPMSRRRTAPMAVLAGIAVLALGAAAYFLGPWRQAEASVDASAVPSVQPVRLTFGPGLQTDAAWSPDGRRIAYAADTDGNFDLFTQGVDGGEPVRVTRSPANETEPAWSPDGGRLVFRSDEGGGGLFTVSINGGPVRRIADKGFRAAWMPDGRDVAYAEQELQAIYLVRADGGEAPREILQGQLADGEWSSFAVHPDGRIGLLGMHPTQRAGFYVSDREHRALYAASSAATLPEAWQNIFGRAHWGRRGDAVFVEAEVAGVPTVWRVPVDPVTQAWGTPVQLTTGVAAAERAAISPDGTSLAFTSIQSTTRAWVFPFDADRRDRPGEGRPVTDEDATVTYLFLAADGSAVYFLEHRPGRPRDRGVRLDLDSGETTVFADDLVTGIIPSPSGPGTTYMVRRPPGKPLSAELEYAMVWRDARGEERFLKAWDRVAVMPSDVRRDERAVLASVMKRAFTGPAQLVEWPSGPSAANAPARVLLDADRKQFWQGRYSPDGRWVAFVALSLERDETIELGVAPSDTHASTWTRIAADHVWPDKPRWSPDGRTLYFLSRPAGGFFALWGVGIDPERGTQRGAPFKVMSFDSPRWHIGPDVWSCEMGIAKGRLVLPMRTVKGSIWLLSIGGT